MNATDTFLQSLQKKSGARVGTMLTLDPRTPDDAAEAMRVGGELGLPANVVSTDPAGFKRQLDQKKNTTALSGAPKTAKWLEDLNNGVLAKDDVDNLSWFEKNVVQSPGALTRSVGRGVVRMGAIPSETTARVAGQRLQDYGKDFDTIYAEELAKIGGEAAPASMRVTAMQVAQERASRVEGMTDADRADVLQRGAAALSEARGVLDRASDIKMSDTAARFRDETLANAENSFLGTLKAFAADPEGGISFVAQTAAEILPVLAASTATTAITRSPAAGVSVMAGGSFLVENSNSAMEFLAEKGVDLSTPEAAALVLDNPELMREASDRGVTRGLVIALFDAASGGVAGQTLMKSPMGEVVVQGVAQMLLGGSGEAAAQKASGQDLNWQEVVIEGLAELVTAPIEVGGVAGRGVLRNLAKSTESGTTAEEIDGLDAMAAKSKLKQRAPDKFAEAIAAQGEADFYVPADDLREYFQAKDVPDDEMLAAWGIDPEEFAAAESTGGDVTVSRSTYAARISGGEDAAWFRDNATRDNAEMSISQAARFNSEVRDTMEKALADAERQRADDLEVRASDVQVYDSMFSQLREAGRTRDVADNEARVWSSFWRTMGDRYGADPLDLARSMGVDVRGLQTPEVSRRRNDLDIRLNTLRSNPEKALKPVGSDLLDFVRSQGGILDMGGDVQAMDAPKGVIAETRDQYEARRGQPSMIGGGVSGRGKGLDDLGRAAIEAGYFPELQGGADIQADGAVIDEAAVLLEALQRAIAGETIYAAGEGPDADMTALSEELSRRGLDLREMSNDEIAAALDQTDGQQYDQSGQLVTDTPEFKAWFGDSEVVDADGNPLVVYHGTDRSFEAFDAAASSSTGVTTRAFFLTESRDVAEGYGANVIAAYAKIETPAEFDFNGRSRIYFDGAERSPSDLAAHIAEINDDLSIGAFDLDGDLRFELEGAGWDVMGADTIDGLILKNVDDSMDAFGGEVTTHYVAFDPTQIKSVFNRGTFDANDPRILYQEEIDLEALISFADEKIAAEPVTSGDVTGSLDEYPAAIPPEYEFSNFRDIGGKIGHMTPDQFLGLASDLAIDEETNDNVNDLAQMMLDGRNIDPPRLSVSDDGVVDSHDGRHRALAAKRLGISRLPVLLMGEKGGAYPEGLTQLKAQSGAGDMGAVVNLTLSEKERTLFQTSGPEQPLAVAHNISARGLEIADAMGGLAAPSLGVVRADIGPLDGFGEITLIAGPELADPKRSGVRAFNSDVYSVRQPRGLTEVSRKNKTKMEDKISPAAAELGTTYFELDSNDLERYGLTHLADQDAVRLAYLRAKGTPFKLKMKKQAAVSAKLKKTLSGDIWSVRQDPAQMAAITEHFTTEAQALVDKFPEKFPDVQSTRFFGDDGEPNTNLVRDLISKVQAAKSGPKVDTYDAGTRLRKKVESSAKAKADFLIWVEDEFGGLTGDLFFEDARGRKKPYDLDSIVSFMKGKIRDAEGFNYGVGNIRSNMAREFKSISQIKDARSDIVTKSEFEAVKKEVGVEFDALLERLKPHLHGSDGFGFYNQASEFIGDFAKGNMRQWRGDNMAAPLTPELEADIRSFLRGLAVLPTEYFEVKMQRAVDFSEFSVALVPKSASKDTLALLRKHGIKVTRYDGNAEGSRAEAMAAMHPKTFFQKYENASKRGSITLPSGGLESGQTVINLFESANLSTFLHESGHFFLEAFTALATSPDAPQAMQDDLAAIHKFLKVDGSALLQTEQHETWARGFEAYVMEGKAPSLELADAFGRFKAWLTRIYRSIAGLNVKLTPEIREVMDRMLATDAEIQAARETQQMSPMFTDQAASGMSDAAWSTYQKMARRSEEQASQALLEKTMAKVRREKEKWWKDERSQVREEVTGMVNSKPEHRLIEMLANQRWIGSDNAVPDFQLDRKELVEAFGDGVLAELSRNRFGGKRAIYGADGMSLYEAADFFGFANPSEMVETLQNTGKRQDAIELETDRIMSDRYGDPLNDGSIEEEAVAAIHSEQQAQTVASEIRHLAGQAGKPTRNMTAKVFRQRARMMLARMAVKDAIRPNAFLEAERKAAKRAEDAFARVARGRESGAALASAAKHKEQQLLNHYLYMESRDLTKMVAAKREKMRDYSKKTVRQKLDGGYIEQIDAILDAYDFRVRSAGQVQRSENLREFVDRMTAEGRAGELSIDSRLMDAAKRKHYTKLSVDELQGLFDTIENIDHMGRFKQKLVDAKEARDMDEVVSGILAEFNANVSGTPPNRTPTPGEARRKLGRDYLNTVLNADTLLREIDGFKELGTTWTALKSRVDAGMNSLTERRVQMAKSFDGIYDAYSAKEKRDMAVKKQNDALGGLFSKWDLISLALNTGNDDNFQRLTNPKIKGHFNQSDIEAALAALDDRDWQTVQNIWDYIDSYWPEISAKEKRQTGLAPTKVEAKQLISAPGFVKGGYYPIKYDSRLSGLAKDFQQKDLAQEIMGGAFGKAQTRNGHTKERNSTATQPVVLDLGIAHAHVEQVLYDLEIGEAVNASWKVLHDPRIREAFTSKGKQSDYDSLEIWMQDVAAGERVAAGGMQSIMRHVRSGFTISRLALNVSTALIQPTGLVQSAVLIGKRAVARGTIDYMSNMPRWVSEVTTVSSLMRERKKTFERDIYNVVGDLEGGPVTGRYEKFQRDVILPLSFWMMQTTQFYAVDMPTWVSAYQKEVKASGNEQKARDYADLMVKRAQGSGLMSDRGMLERGTLNAQSRQQEFPRMLTALGSYMFAKGNVFYEKASQTDFKSPVQVMALAADIGLLFTLEAVLYSAVKGYLPGEDEDEPIQVMGWLGGQTLASLASTLPLMRELSGAVQGFNGGGIFGSAVEVLAKPMIQASQGEADKALVKSFLDAGGVMLHLPSSQSKAVLDSVFDADMSINNEVSPLKAIGLGGGKGRSLADIMFGE